MTSSRDYYELLGISSSADGETLRKAFCKLSKELHPDTTSLPKDEAAYRFQQVCEAYELLADPKMRQSYDLILSDRQFNNQKTRLQSDLAVKNSFHNQSFVGQRRPLSGGELFSLLLLGIALLISLLLGLGFGIIHGRELITKPTWLTTINSMSQVSCIRLKNEFLTSEYNSFKSTLFKGT